MAKFEEALKGLEKSAQDLKTEGNTLDEALKAYEEGMKYYEQCSEILSEAKQKIQIYKRK
mgnify:FL=1